MCDILKELLLALNWSDFIFLMLDILPPSTDGSTVRNVFLISWNIIELYVFKEIKIRNRPKKLIPSFSGTAMPLSTPCTQTFCFISSIYIEKLSIHREYQFNLATIFLVYVIIGWLNSGAPTLVNQHHWFKLDTIIFLALEVRILMLFVPQCCQHLESVDFQIFFYTTKVTWYD